MVLRKLLVFASWTSKAISNNYYTKFPTLICQELRVCRQNDAILSNFIKIRQIANRLEYVWILPTKLKLGGGIVPPPQYTHTCHHGLACFASEICFSIFSNSLSVTLRVQYEIYCSSLDQSGCRDFCVITINSFTYCRTTSYFHCFIVCFIELILMHFNLVLIRLSSDY